MKHFVVNLFSVIVVTALLFAMIGVGIPIVAHTIEVVMAFWR